MLFEKKMFGQLPFCCSASSSVPGAPASSLATESQLEVLKPGVEICAPVWVAVALLCTFHPVVAPRFEISLAPLSDGEVGPAASAEAADGLVKAEGAAWAPDAATSDATPRAVAAQTAELR